MNGYCQLAILSAATDETRVQAVLGEMAAGMTGRVSNDMVDGMAILSVMLYVRRFPMEFELMVLGSGIPDELANHLGESFKKLLDRTTADHNAGCSQ